MDVARRDRVLAYPDLAKRLTEPPLRLRDPTDWTGWIPPRTAPEDACGPRCGRDYACRGLHLAANNDSPIRAQLVAIAAEAWRRDQAQLAAAEEAARDLAAAEEAAHATTTAEQVGGGDVDPDEQTGDTSR